MWGSPETGVTGIYETHKMSAGNRGSLQGQQVKTSNVAS